MIIHTPLCMSSSSVVVVVVCDWVVFPEALPATPPCTTINPSDTNWSTNFTRPLTEIDNDYHSHIT